MNPDQTSGKKITTASGRPYSDPENSLTAGPRGPVLLEDYILQEKLAHFNRERIPERVVHAKGSGAFGTFTVTQDITRFTKADIFSEIGKSTDVFVRFSTVGGEAGSADTERDPRGFAVKFYSKQGNWDLVGNNTPVFFIKDAKKFPDFIHTQKRDPHTHLKSPTMMWDFWSLNPESLHQVILLMSDRGTPYGYRFMNGYGSHTFSMINARNERVWVKFHFKSMQGIRNFTGKEADEMKTRDMDFSQRDLVNAIQSGDYPKWAMKIQVMTEEQARELSFNPFDVTKVWPHSDFPLIEAGILELNRLPRNYFAEVEQSAFAPAHVVNGIGFSPDKMLQGRLFAYPDAHRYRLGANYEQIPVNRCPYGVTNYQRDGMMRVDGNGEDGVNYFPNSFDGVEADQTLREPALSLYSDMADWFDRNGVGEEDHYSQPAQLINKVMNEAERSRLVDTLVGSMKGIEGSRKELIINRQLCHFFRMDAAFGMRIANGLGVDVGSIHRP